MVGGPARAAAILGSRGERRLGAGSCGSPKWRRRAVRICWRRSWETEAADGPARQPRFRGTEMARGPARAAVVMGNGGGRRSGNRRWGRGGRPPPTPCVRRWRRAPRGPFGPSPVASATRRRAGCSRASRNPRAVRSVTGASEFFRRRRARGGPIADFATRRIPRPDGARRSSTRRTYAPTADAPRCRRC
ncbi:hypothetical protein A33M_2539 [Rhodovulum sp. PH10]|nr:hypothetical protein A33M_2539 [Rhodovulum sp. PH10]